MKLIWARYCPVCEKVWDKSHDYCPIHEGVLLVRVYNYGKGFVIYDTPDISLSDLPIVDEKG